MKANRAGDSIEIPDVPPTPRMIKRGDQIFILGTNNEYFAQPWYDEDTGSLYRASGAIEIEGKR